MASFCGCAVSADGGCVLDAGRARCEGSDRQGTSAPVAANHSVGCCAACCSWHGAGVCAARAVRCEVVWSAGGGLLVGWLQPREFSGFGSQRVGVGQVPEDLPFPVGGVNPQSLRGSGAGLHPFVALSQVRQG